MSPHVWSSFNHVLRLGLTWKAHFALLFSSSFFHALTCSYLLLSCLCFPCRLTLTLQLFHSPNLTVCCPQLCHELFARSISFFHHHTCTKITLSAFWQKPFAMCLASSYSSGSFTHALKRKDKLDLPAPSSGTSLWVTDRPILLLLLSSSYQRFCSSFTCLCMIGLHGMFKDDMRLLHVDRNVACTKYSIRLRELNCVSGSRITSSFPRGAQLCMTYSMYINWFMFRNDRFFVNVYVMKCCRRLHAWQGNKAGKYGWQTRRLSKAVQAKVDVQIIHPLAHLLRKGGHNQHENNILKFCLILSIPQV